MALCRLWVSTTIVRTCRRHCRHNRPCHSTHWMETTSSLFRSTRQSDRHAKQTKVMENHKMGKKEWNENDNSNKMTRNDIFMIYQTIHNYNKTEKTNIHFTVSNKTWCEWEQEWRERNPSVDVILSISKTKKDKQRSVHTDIVVYLKTSIGGKNLTVIRDW